MKTRRWMLGGAACVALLLSACGQDKQETSASSFSSVRDAPIADGEQVVPPEKSLRPTGDLTAAGNSLTPEASAKSSPAPDSASASGIPAAPSLSASSAPDGRPTEPPAALSRSATASSAPTSEQPAESPSAARKRDIPSSEGPAAQASDGGKGQEGRSAASGTSNSEPSAVASFAAPSAARKSPVSPPPSTAVVSGGAPVPSAQASPLPAKSKTEAQGTVKIGWSEFFDGGDQTRPSERFWDLSESGGKVSIKGFMGEVLSFEKRWFLLIPEPGAECPFDNGDETYWNKIMIVFVPDNAKLRHKSGLLRITGQLEVGIKIDESGYKTMFRLYDAAFEEVKE